MRFWNLIVGIIIQLLGGICLIYAVNEILSFFNINAGVGINPFTIAVAGLLGVPGIIAVYGLSLIISS